MVCVVAQTTQSENEFIDIVERIKTRFPDAVIFDTICDSTEKRQSEVKALAAEMDAVFIVGGRNSANTKRLVRISQNACKPTFHIETADELSDISSRQAHRRPTGSLTGFLKLLQATRMRNRSRERGY
jgi:4-hydroxy-3-methylbut-2-enyl diphosphate reductase